MVRASQMGRRFRRKGRMVVMVNGDGDGDGDGSGGGDGGRQQEVEFAYRLPISRNIYLMPSVYWIMQPNNFSSNPDIFIFNLQTQFLF